MERMNNALSLLCHVLSALCHALSALCHALSVLCHALSVLCQASKHVVYPIAVDWYRQAVHSLSIKHIKYIQTRCFGTDVRTQERSLDPACVQTVTIRSCS